MDPNALAGMAFTLILVVLIGGFILTFPLAKRLGLLIESKIQDKNDPGRVEETRKLKEQIRTLESQVRLLAERQQFTEQLLAQRSREALPAGSAED